MSRNPDVLVIGGGIVGAACAHALSAAGVTVQVVEQSFPASGTSRACDGLVLCFDKLTGPELAMARQSAVLWAELSESLGADFHYSRRGSIVAVEAAEGLAPIAQKATMLRGAGIRAELLDGKDLLRLEPCLAPDLAGGVYYPDDAQLDARLATVALMEAARGSGAQLRQGVRVLALRRSADGVGVEADTPSGVISAGAVVLAAGVWSVELALTMGITLPVKPRKGHILVSSAVRPPGAGRLLTHPLLEGSYAASVASAAEKVEVALVAEMTAGGTLLLGSSREFAGYDTSISVPVITAIAQRAVRFIPPLAQASVIRTYVGLRPWSPDHLPLVGPVSQAPGLYLATGHEGAGIGLAPVTGQLIARWISGGELPEYAHAARPDRFALSN